MSTTRFSQSPYLRILSLVIATVPLGTGILLLLNPQSALTMLEFDPPTSAADVKLVHNLVKIFGARDVFMGLAVYAAAYFGTRKTLGCLIIAGSFAPLVDGAVSRAQIGRGEWFHWGFVPVMIGVGGMLLGVFDRR